MAADQPDIYADAERRWLEERGWEFCGHPFAYHDPVSGVRYTREEAVAIQERRDREGRDGGA